MIGSIIKLSRGVLPKAKEVRMEFLQNPNVIYLMLVGGMVFAVLALAAPGTGILEIGAIFILGFAGWSAVASGLPINWWALVLLGIGAILFLFAVFRARTWPILAVSIIAAVIGSAYLFSGSEWYIPAVNPALTVVVSIVTGGFFWIVGRKSIQAALIRPTHDLGGLIGKIGEAKTYIHEEGSVLVASELWSAVSEKPIQSGKRVRVIGREGFTLTVEPLEKEEPKD
jgi:membrane-bound serine protease (ClpP class)